MSGSYCKSHDQTAWYTWLVELHIEEIMERIGFRENLEETPLSSDYFDLIGGTAREGKWSSRCPSRMCAYRFLAS